MFFILFLFARSLLSIFCVESDVVHICQCMFNKLFDAKSSQFRLFLIVKFLRFLIPVDFSCFLSISGFKSIRRMEI